MKDWSKDLQGFDPWYSKDHYFKHEAPTTLCKLYHYPFGFNLFCALVHFQAQLCMLHCSLDNPHTIYLCNL